jgi:hypothetical protein
MRSVTRAASSSAFTKDATFEWLCRPAGSAADDRDERKGVAAQGAYDEDGDERAGDRL